MVRGISGNPNIQQAQPSIPGGSRLGNHSIAITGNPPLSLNKLGTEKIPFQGFTKATRKSRAEIGLTQSVFNAMGALSWKDGKINPANIARSLNTVQNYLQREVNLETIKADQVEAEFLGRFAMVISGMTNQELNSAFQGLVSRPMQDLLTGIKNELAAGVKNEALRNNLSELYDNISRIEILLLQEINNRMVIGEDPNAATTLPHLTTRFPLQSIQGHGVQFINQHYVERADDMSAKSLGAMASRSLTQSDQVADALVATDTRMQTHGFDKLSTRELGDIIRSSELTINVSADKLMGDGASPAIFGNDGQGQVNPQEDLKNGALNPQNKMGGPASDNGDCVIVLKESVKQQCTYTLKDNFKVLPAKVDDEAKERLVAHLVAHKDDFSDETQAQLNDPASELRQTIDHLFQILQENDNVTLDDVIDLMEPQLKNYLYPRGWAPGTADRALISSYLAEPLVDREAVAADIGVTYDSMELLFTQIKDFDLFYTEQMAEQLRRGQAPGVQVGGAGYIGAQFHKPITKEDVQEIRVDRRNIAAGFEREFDAKTNRIQSQLLDECRTKHNFAVNTSYEVVKAQMIKDLVDEKIDRLRAYADSIDVKFEVTDSTSVMGVLKENAELAASFRAQNAASKALEDEFLTIANDFSMKPWDELQNRFVAAMTPELATYLQTKYGQLNLADLPIDVRNIFQDALGDGAEVALQSSPESPDQVINHMFDNAVRIFHSRMVLAEEVAKLRFMTSTNRDNFRDSVLKLIISRGIPAENVPFLVQNTFMIHSICRNASSRERLARRVLDELSETHDEVARLREAVGDGPIFGTVSAYMLNYSIIELAHRLSNSVAETHPNRLMSADEVEYNVTSFLLTPAIIREADLMFHDDD